MKRIQSKKHKLGTYKNNKISLSCFDDKSYVLDDGIRTLAYFHKDSVRSCNKREEIKKDYNNEDCKEIKKDYDKEDSNVNEAIRAISNLSFFFPTKRPHMQQKHIKYKDATKQKHKNANKRISDFFPLRYFYAHFLFLFAGSVSCFCACGIFE